MKDFINSKMDEFYNEFKYEIKKLDRYCDFKKLRYDGNNIPDYSQKTVRLLYLLRYFPAYAVEYFGMYHYLLKKMPKLPLSILSVGCGCGTDYYGLHFSLSENDVNPAAVSYHGVDLIDWGYFDNLENDNAVISVDNILDRNCLPSAHYNVLSFPKSIGEFNSATFEQLLAVISNTQFTCDNLYIANSLREQRKGIDVSKTGRICELFLQKGYVANDKPTEYCYFKDKTALRKRFAGQFDYSDEIRNYITELAENCPQYLENGENCEADCKDMNKQPIFYDTYIKFQVIELEKK